MKTVMLIILFPLSSSLLLEVWSLDQPCRHQLGACLYLFFSHEVSRELTLQFEKLAHFLDAVGTH